MTEGPERACLAIADISGYTSYLAGVELDHAQDILSDLTVTVVEAMAPFQLLKLEGDAAFVHVPGDSIDGSMLQDAIESTYIAFRRRLRDVRQASTCECAACIRIPDLDLKFVIHHGAIGRQQLMGLDEVVGSEVILVHRLLKNRVEEQTGVSAYALYTQAAVEAAAIDPVAQGLREHHEQTDVAGEVTTWVTDLEAVWQRLLAQPRRTIPPEQRVRSWDMRAAAPPAVVFEILTSPLLRPTWDLGIDYVREESPAGRRGPSTVNHCVHGKDAIIEEILDWRPPEYWMTRTTLPAAFGALRFQKTEELTRTPDGGTRIAITIGTDEGRSPDQDQALLAFVENAQDRFDAVMAAVDAAASERARSAAPSPELPARPGRHLSEPVQG